MSLFRLLLFMLFLPVAALAQSWPKADDLYVNDWARVLPDEAKARIAPALRQTRETAGIHVVLVTMNAAQTPGATNCGIEAYATGLFNAWGIGDRNRNDGILILVWPDRRTLRIELGRGYGTVWDGAAAQVINTAFVPQFRAGNMAAGIESGVQATISQIAWPFAKKAAPPRTKDWSGLLAGSFLLAVLGVWVGGVALIGNLNARAKCPNCGKPATPFNVLRQPIPPFVGNYATINRYRCAHCGHEWQVRGKDWVERDHSFSGPSGGFGGGSSSGGGATGRW